MAQEPRGSARTLVIVGPEGKFYAVPIHELERHAHDLDSQKQLDLDRLVSEAIRNGRLTVGFYIEKEVIKDSAALRP